MTKLTCTICNIPWVDESLVSSQKKHDLEDERKVEAPCSHGFAFIIRQFDLINNMWFYKQIDFIKKQ